MISCKGTIVEIIFRNDENGYTVALMETDNEILTITGVFASDITNHNLEIYGDLSTHPKYGEQFKVEAYNSLLPTDLVQIENYLSSGVIKGIGEHIAKKIVEKFKEDSFSIIQHFPERLTEIDGIGKKKADVISKSFVEQAELKEILMFLQSHNIGTNLGIKIYKKYGQNTINIINENPYKLTEDIYGIGFKLADKIAFSLGVEKSSPFRIISCVKYKLIEYASNGHCFMPYDILLQDTCSLLEVDSSYVENEIRNMAFDKKLHIEFINDNKVIYYTPYHMAEVNVCKKLIELSSVDFNIDELHIFESLSEIEKESSITLTDKQREAVVKSVIYGINVITGGPGTGKTTIIKSIIQIFEKLNKTVLLCSPTGRAAKRMTESTQKEAKTIHRLLEYSHGESDSSLSFKKNDESPLSCDAIIVDETSMVDILLMNNLLKAIKHGTRLILVGDSDQLPSVGAGNVLLDIIQSNAINTVRLDKIFRQSSESMIVENAHLINNGSMPVFNKKNTDFFLIREFEPSHIKNTIIDLYKYRLIDKYNLTPTLDIQVLSPMKKGDTGVIELNKNLQSAINPPSKYKKEKNFGTYVFRVGDKVMQIKNNYQLEWSITNEDESVTTGEGVYNGDIGYIIFIDENLQELYVEFDDKKEVIYSFNQLDELILAYATTVHKSQGSEFPVIIMPLSWAPPMLLMRNLLYTAITRAKKLVILVGQEKFLKMMIDNDKINNRYSALDYRLSLVVNSYNILNIE